MRKIAEGVWQEEGGLVSWGEHEVAMLKREAPRTEKRRARILAHQQSDGTHQMLIAFCDDSRNPRHSHPKPESLYVIEGEMVVHFEDCDVFLSAGDYLRIPAGLEHEPRPLTDCVILETAEK